MNRERVLKAILVIVGLFFTATIYPLLGMHLDETLQMMLSLYVTLGIFLLLASRTPSAHRGLIAFARGRALPMAALWPCSQCIMWVSACTC